MLGDSLRAAWLPACVAIALIPPNGMAAQTQYRNLDAGHPVRIEGADPTPRFALEADLAPFQLERLTGGTTRYRAEPRFSYGVLPFTEIEVRLPFVEVHPPTASGALAVAGMAGLSIGAMHAFNLETDDVPAFALATDVLLPVGNLAGSKPSFIVKGLLTKTTTLGRLHLNAGIGTYSIHAPGQPSASCSGLIAPGDTAGCGSVGQIPFIYDIPCNVAPGTTGRLNSASARQCMASLPPAAVAAPVVTPVVTPTSGERWFAGAAFDHSLPLRSTLLVADVFTERFLGLYPIADWTAEVGVRHQVTPLLVVDAGVGRRFAGSTQSTTFTAGAAYQFATPPWR